MRTGRARARPVRISGRGGRPEGRPPRPDPVLSCGHGRLSVSGAQSRPNHRVYIEALRRLTPEQRLLKAFELTDMSRALFRDGLRARFPQASDAELERIYLERLEKCHNRRS